MPISMKLSVEASTDPDPLFKVIPKPIFLFAEEPKRLVPPLFDSSWLIKRSVEAGVKPEEFGPLPRATPIYAYMLASCVVTLSAKTTFILSMQGMVEEAMLAVVGAVPLFV